MSAKTFVFDLDGTITTGEESKPRVSLETDLVYYQYVDPNWEMIQKMKELKKEGHRIIIHTARGMFSCGGNVDLVKQRLGTVTIDWLRQHGVPYDEIVFGKPYASAYYIDDKNLSIKDFLEGNYEKN